MDGFKAGFVAIVGGLLVGCGDGGSHAPSDAGSPEATLISAAQGGVVADSSGDITLTIPAGALATDTEITLKVVPKYAEALVAVGQFGPDGLVFAKPATLAIKAASTLVPAGHTLVIGLDEGGTFTPVPGSTSQDNVVSAPIEHFSSYSLMAGNEQPTLRCDNSVQLSLVPADPGTTEMVYTGLNIAVPNFFKDNVLITSCDPPMVVNHLPGSGTVTIPFCLAVCAATGHLAVVSSSAAVATVVYGTGICGGFFIPAESLTVPADILVPLSGCQ
jgi:hypothetical protein